MLGDGQRLRQHVVAPKGGGGDKFEPQTAEEARERLEPQVASAIERVKAIPAELRADRLYIEAKLLPNYLAASSFPGGLFARVNAIPVGSRTDVGLHKTAKKAAETPTKRVILSVSDDGLQELAALLHRTLSTKADRDAFSQLKTLDTLAISEPALRTNLEPARAWEAVLHPYPSASGASLPASNATLDKWFDLVRQLGGEVPPGLVRTVAGLTFTGIRLPEDRVEEALRFNPLRVLRPVPGMRRRPRLRVSPARPFLPLAQPVTHPHNAPRVAVFDGGTTAVTKLFPEASIDLTTAPPDPDEQAHGTAVLGAVLYGAAQPGGTASAPPLPVDSYRVVPEEDQDDFAGKRLLSQIVDCVNATKPAIVNLSLGIEEVVEDDQEPNEWTSTLDALAWEKDVLFVVAAGNDGMQNQALGLHRVQVPADMVNGLSVGAADSATPTRGWKRAPYSSQGPGRPGSLVQPVCVQFGGSAPNYFPLLQPDGKFWFDEGTSFATPLVTHALAELLSDVPASTPNTLRAFAVHFAERHQTPKKLRDEIGYGRAPLSFRDALECSADEVHLLYSDEIGRTELIGYQLPIPDQYSTGVELEVTLAYSSPTDPAEATEYTQASIGLTVRPHERMYRFSAPHGASGKAQVIDSTSPAALELLTRGWRQSQEPVAVALGRSTGAPEAKLRESGKWETLRRARIPSSTQLLRPRIEVSYVARASGQLDRSPSSLEFALIVTARDKKSRGGIYDLARAQFKALQPLVSLQPRVQARL